MKIAIPARFASSRFPGKPLAMIAGTPMIERVWRQAVQAVEQPDDVIVATDDQRIAATVQDFGGISVMTRPDHENGTERLAELVDTLGFEDSEIIVNVQGDEPLIDPGLIKLVGSKLEAHPDAALATAADQLHDPSAIASPDIVKVVSDKFGYAHYFSRSPLPNNRDGQDVPAMRHIGIYAYRAGTLRFLKDAEPAPTEIAEKLEQLRALWHGLKIYVATYAGAPSVGVDTEQDVARVEAILAEQRS